MAMREMPDLNSPHRAALNASCQEIGSGSLGK
jgi:hypothetical protein